MPRLLLAFPSLLIVWCCLTPAARGQSARDKITLLDEKTGSRTRILCTVLDHTGEFVRYKIRDDGPTTVKPSAQVISIETPQIESHIEALEKYAAGETRQATALFEQALKQDPRGWVRRDILAMLVRCALRLNNPAQAGDRFLLIYASDKRTQHFKGIPLQWTTAPPSTPLKAAALNWQTQNTPAAKLLAASALLFDLKYQSSAKLDLQQLRANSDSRLRYLAIAQLWRLDIRERNVENPTLASWKDAIRSMPKELRGGPYFVIGEARRLRREYDLAAVSLLWLPMVYDHDYQLSAMASLNAADSLSAIGQQAEAVSLYREVVRRYGQSSYAQDAAQAIKELALEQAPPETSQNP